MTATLTRLGFTVDTKPFVAAVAWAAKRLPSHPTVPVLGGMLMVVNDGQLTVSAYDYEAAASATIDVDNATDGAVLVSGRLLHGLASTLDDDQPLRVTYDGSKVTVDYGGILTLPTMPVEDYPQLPVAPATVGTVDASAFAQLIDRVAVCVSTETAVPALLGVALRLGPGRLVALASDRYRGAVDQIPFEYDGPETELLVPGEALKAVAPMLGEAGGQLAVSADANLFGMTAGGRSLVVQLFATEFPKIDRLMPPRSDTPILLPVAKVAKAIKRAGLTRDKVGPVILTFSAGQVVVGSTDGDNRIAEPVPFDYDGPDVELATNPHYFSDALRASGGSVVELSIPDDPKRPFLVSAVDDDMWRYFAMPIRIRD